MVESPCSHFTLCRFILYIYEAYAMAMYAPNAENEIKIKLGTCIILKN
jgi:hypothetical protein